MSKQQWNALFKSTKAKFANKTEPRSAVIEFSRLLKKNKCKKILDLGCGSGRHVVYLAKKKFFVVGSDISTVALKLSNEWCKKEKLNNYTLIEHKMTKFPFPDNHFDAMLSINVIEHAKLKDIKNTINEIYRTLRKDGLALITTPSIHDTDCGKGRKVGKNEYIIRSGLHHFFEKKEVKTLFKKFKILELKEYDRFTNHCHWKLVLRK